MSKRLAWKVPLAVGLILLLSCSGSITAHAHAQALTNVKEAPVENLLPPATVAAPADASDTAKSSSDSSSSNPTDNGAPQAVSSMFAVGKTSQPQTGIDWGHLLASSMFFLTVEHSFRYSTEATTRRSFHQPYFEKYAGAVGNLHGWADGDPFLVNYVGHPMQGAVSGFIWQHNDRAYRTVEFGRNRPYWKEKLRGMAFAYVYSVQFEIGPISEASLGHIQGMYPQVGFVDHVITPTVGMGWAVAEDAIDRMIVQRLEARYGNPYFRLLARGVLNPSRSFANVMTGNLPWHRDDRPGVFKPFPETALWTAESQRRMESKPVNPPPGVAPFDFTFHATFMDYVGNANSGPCMGGGGTAGFRVAPTWQIALDVSGCGMLDFKNHWSGDTLTYMVGPRWTPQTSGRWVPHLQAMVGGIKVTQEYRNPTLEAEVADWHPINDEERTAKHAFYATNWDNSAFAMKAGGGVDYKFNNALELRLANLEYAHTWANDVNGFNYHNAVEFSGGLVLRMGTW